MSNPPIPGLAAANAKSQAIRGAERAQGLAWARQWRARNKPYFDALYGPDAKSAQVCSSCGRPN